MKLALFSLGLAVLLVVPCTAAQAPRSYAVEILVFRHLEPSLAGERFDLPVVEPLTGEQSEPPPAFGNFPRLDAASLDLAAAHKRLATSSRFEPLLLEGWMQAPVSEDQSTAYRVLGGTPGARISGRVLFTRERFLHLDVELDLTIDGVTYHIEEDRHRVQSGRPHYLDHPLFGVILQIRPVRQ